jgi:hypothetical protein
MFIVSSVERRRTPLGVQCSLKRSNKNEVHGSSENEKPIHKDIALLNEC